jgi:hypothetical protein
MKWIYWLLAILTIVAALPVAEATVRLQGFGTGLLGFNGPSSLTVSRSDYTTRTNWGPSYASTYVNTGDVRFAASARRPTSVVAHRFADHNQNYRTVEYGKWQLQSADMNLPRSQTAARYRNTPAGPMISAVSGDYRGASPIAYGRGSSYAYAQRYNVGAFTNPWVGSSYVQPSTLAAYTAQTNTYY